MDFAKSEYSLIKHFDRADFPVNLDENLKPLLENEHIIVSSILDNGTPFEYSITEKGKNYINVNFNDQEIIEHIKRMDNPEFILKITKTLIDKKNGL